MILQEQPLYLQDLKTVLSLTLKFEKLQNSRILITGATGLIGTVLVDMLDLINKEKHLNISLDIITRNKERTISKFAYIKDTSINVIEHDILKSFDCDTDYSFIIHGASNTHPVLYANDPVGSLATNVFGTYYLLEAARKCSNPRFVLLSSVEIYGEDTINCETGFKETDFGYLDCNTVRANYCEGKRASESLCQAYKSQYNIDVVIPRPCRSYGPTLKKDDTKALSQFLKNGVDGKDIVLKSEGKQFYSYLYVSDVVTGILFCMLNGQNGEAYNIADKKSDITLRDLATLIARLSDTKVIFDIPQLDEKKGFSKATRAILDSTKLQQLGWKPFYTIETGIERTLRLLK